MVPCSKSPIIVEDNYGETPITRAEKHQDVIEYLLQFSKENENNYNPNGSPSSTMEVSKSSDDEISTEVVDDKDKHIPLQILNRLDGKKCTVCKYFLDYIFLPNNLIFIKYQRGLQSDTCCHLS